MRSCLGRHDESLRTRSIQEARGQDARTSQRAKDRGTAVGQFKESVTGEASLQSEGVQRCSSRVTFSLANGFIHLQFRLPAIPLIQWTWRPRFGLFSCLDTIRTLVAPRDSSDGSSAPPIKFTRICNQVKPGDAGVRLMSTISALFSCSHGLEKACRRVQTCMIIVRQRRAICFSSWVGTI